MDPRRKLIRRRRYLNGKRIVISNLNTVLLRRVLRHYRAMHFFTLLRGPPIVSTKVTDCYIACCHRYAMLKWTSALVDWPESRGNLTLPCVFHFPAKAPLTFNQIHSDCLRMFRSIHRASIKMEIEPLFFAFESKVFTVEFFLDNYPSHN